MFHQIHRHWHNFRPRRGRHGSPYRRRDYRLDKIRLRQQEPVPFVCNSSDIFDCAEQTVVGFLQRRPELHDLERDIDRLSKRFMLTRQPLDGLVALLAQTPRAVLAQLQMDAHPHGYRDKQARLYELIDFNDTLDSTVLAMDPTHRQVFADRVKQAADRICKRVGAPCFDDQQWSAIIKGLSREIAIYLAAKNNGFNATMTARAQDALGVDMQIQDPETGHYINVDCKTPSAFRYRLEQLVEEKRMSPHEQVLADERSYALVTNGHGGHHIEVILIGILPDKFGQVEHFEFVDTTPIREMLNFLIRQYGRSDGRFGVI